MSQRIRYRVLREHHGDKPYVAGDERVAEASSVAHLVPHVLEEIGPAPEEKAEGASDQNKSEGASPSNKAQRRRSGGSGAKAKARKGQ